MANTPYQSFALTFLLCTPSALHETWMNQGQDWPTLRSLMEDLNFSSPAIANAKTAYFEPLNSPDHRDLRDSMKNVAEKLKLDFYPPGSAHPIVGEAYAIVSALRKLDENSDD